jgi:hypothetical protein
VIRNGVKIDHLENRPLQKSNPAIRLGNRLAGEDDAFSFRTPASSIAHRLPLV